MNDIRHSFAQQGLIRSADHRILGGVSAGIGRRIGVGPWTARLLLVLVMLILPGAGFLIYPILWILMPTEKQARSYDLPAGPVAPSAPPAPAQ